MDLLNSPIGKLALTGLALWAIWKFAPNQEIKVMALGAAGVLAANQLPLVRDGLNQRLVA